MHSLYALQNAGSVPCGSCGRPIDVWLEHGYQLSRRGITRDPTVTRRRCPDCLLQRGCPSEGCDTIRAAYELQRAIARETGMPPGVTSYPFANGGNPADGTRAYSAIGHAVHVRGWDASSDVRPHLTFIPEDPSQQASSLVFFAARVYHSDVKFAYLKIVWPFHDLSLPERFEVVNATDPDVSESDLAKLMRGRRFWHKMVRQGRATGTGNYTPEAFRDDIERILTMNEQDGIRITNADMLVGKLAIGKTQMYEMFKLVPEAHERFKQHKRKPIS